MPKIVANRTSPGQRQPPDPATPARSVDPEDYQTVPRPVAAMAKSFPGGFEADAHAPARDQLIYAVSGVMRVRTASEAWIVPPDRAVYVPGGMTHTVAMRGQVEMRTLFIRPDAAPDRPAAATVLEVSDLLRAIVLALTEEPIAYDAAGRGGLLASLALDEIARARPLSLVIPMPRDRRLVRLCDALLADPHRQETLEVWSEQVGASPRTLSRLFQEEIGLSFTVWRQRVRFYSALEALVRGEPVGLVARANGYASSSAFAAAFRKSLGVSPGSVFRATRA